jgi:transposase
MDDTQTRRPRRQFTDEFKASVVRLVLDEGGTVSALARDIDPDPRSCCGRGWSGSARIARIARTVARAWRSPSATGSPRLREENRELRAERDVLRKASAFSAKHQQ